MTSSPAPPNARPPVSSSTSPLAAGEAALRRFWRPFVLIQAAAVALAVAYHESTAVRAACAIAARWKTSGGSVFAAVSTAFAGGILPELAKLAAGGGRRALRGRAGEIAFNTAFFALNGVVIDALYAAEAAMFGSGAGLLTVVEKTAFDQLVFTPIWLVFVTLLFAWRQREFSWHATRPLLRRGFYRARVMPLLIPSFLFWIPMVSIIYAMPVALQFLLFIPALGAWSLIMVFVADGR
jgi:hypothetical protein